MQLVGVCELPFSYVKWSLKTLTGRTDSLEEEIKHVHCSVHSRQGTGQTLWSRHRFQPETAHVHHRGPSPRSQTRQQARGRGREGLPWSPAGRPLSSVLSQRGAEPGEGEGEGAPSAQRSRARPLLWAVSANAAAARDQLCPAFRT